MRRLSFALAFPPLLVLFAACGDDETSTGGTGGATTATTTTTSTTGGPSTSSSGSTGTGGQGTGGAGVGGSGGEGGGACTPEDDGNDCTADVCEGGTTTHEPLASGEPCSLGVCDGSGVCVECLEDMHCTGDDYCALDNTCTAPTCTDMLTNGNETDKDCGGGTCPPCPDNYFCAVGSDCQSGVCQDNGMSVLVCAAPACGDGVVNGSDGCDDGNMVNGDGCDNNCMPTGCGNGVVSAGEGCDDGNAQNGDGCDNNCTPTACGNGVLSGTEACDDGNLTDGDGCDSSCTFTACGNGIATAGEACDDGNLTDGDGCDNNCTVSGCGNGVVAGAEACDDGNLTDGDGCDSNCTATACGNGVVAGAEACDDGNLTNGDGCDNNCTVSGCGNGVVAGAEACDDGNLINGDGCDNNCTATGCGNGIVSMGEACDDGNLTNGDCCSSACQNESTCELEPNNACADFDTMDAMTGSPLATLIKGTVTPAADVDYYQFTIPGTLPAHVQLETYFGTPGTCTSTSINDTTIDFRGATCDTVDITDLDDGVGWCSLVTPATDAAARSLPPGTYYVSVRHNGTTGTTAQYTLNVTVVGRCGDGAVAAFEGCDDGNNSPGDGCSAACTVEAGYLCSGAPSTCALACGNGVINAGESCDDGNTGSGDGCSSACAVEPGYLCSGAPSVCLLPEIICNDGIDNNGGGGIDGADPTCALPAYFTGCGAGETLRVYPQTAGLAIPDNNTTGVTSNITVSAAGTLARVAVLYTITHTWDEDVDVSLIPPSASAIDVCSDNGGSGDNFTNTLLDTACMTNVTAGTAPFSGCYIPENAASVSALVGTSADGTWGLRAVDDDAALTGTLQSWRLVMCTTP